MENKMETTIMGFRHILGISVCSLMSFLVDKDIMFETDDGSMMRCKLAENP